jgi:hypothetical protein
LPPQWATTEAARRGPEGHIKDYSHDSLLKETSNGQRQSVKENFTFTKKGKTLTLCSNLELAVRDDVVVDEDVDE